MIMMIIFKNSKILTDITKQLSDGKNLMVTLIRSAL